MPAKMIPVLIVVFWLITMSGLMRDEILPAVMRAREVSQSASYEELDRLVPASRVTQMGIYMGTRRVGRSVTWMRRNGHELTIESETEINLRTARGLSALTRLIGGGVHGLINFRATVIKGRLLEFRATVASPPGAGPAVIVDGKPVGDQLHLSIRQFGQTRHETVPFDQRQFVRNALAPSFSPKNLKVGAQWHIKSLDHTNYTVTSALAKVVGKEKVDLSGVSYDTYVVEIQNLFKMRVWVTADGDVVKQQFLAFTFIQEEPSPEVIEELYR